MLAANADFDSYKVHSIDSYKVHSITALINAWSPLTFAVSSLNRSMGQPDLYPFALSMAAIDKLGYIDRLIHSRPSGSQAS
jgi:hypothetical protein